MSYGVEPHLNKTNYTATAARMASKDWNKPVHPGHYENTPMQYTTIFHGCKNDDVLLIFFF